jgi:2-polyprenyl-6-methoxyphenol hydroxylase-like FAD-dependent oxidoreductase
VRQENSNGKRHAIVIGGSIAGLLTARVLRDHFDQVTLIERDSYPSQPAARKGVPQGNHVHVLMKRGQLILEELFPGLTDQLIASGALEIDMASESAWLTPAGFGVNFRSGLTMLTMTRPLLDSEVRRRLLPDRQITILDNTEVVSLIPNETNEDVVGVVIRARVQDTMASTHVPLHSDLVVDATGRGSAAPRWLEELGFGQPKETVINAFQGYSSRLFKKPGDSSEDWKCAYIQSAPPHRKRGGIIFPVEGDRWLLSLVGGGRDYPPSDEQGYLEFAQNLAHPMIYNAVKDLEPCSPIHSYRAAENRLRHYELMDRLPNNFLVIGDATCAFNPVYGQGMTIAAIGALTLSETLADQKKRFSDGSLKGMSSVFQKRLAKVNSAPWLLATGEDCRFLETEGAKPNFKTRFMHSYLDRVVELTITDKEVRRTLIEIFHMLRKPNSLFHPKILLKVIWLSLFSPRQTVNEQKHADVGRISQQVLRKSQSAG